MGSRTGHDEASAPEETPYQKSALRDYAETILICVIFVLFSRTFVFQQSKIPSESMMDTLLVGDYIMVNRFLYAPTSYDWECKLLPCRDVERGDVIVFKHPPDPKLDYIKRVIGLPGETVELRNGTVYVDGRRLDEPYVPEAYRLNDPKGNYPPTVVGEHSYLVMGDHRNKSSDSRVWGQVPAHLIKGRALLIWMSYDEAPRSPQTSAGETVRGWWSKIRHPERFRLRRFFDLIH